MKLTHRIFLLILIITLLSSLASFFLTQYQEEALHNDSEKILARTIIQSLRDALVRDVINNNKLRVTNLLKRLREHDNPIDFLYITKGPDNKVFAHSFRQGFPRYLVESTYSHDHQINIRLTAKYQTEQGLIYEYSEPLIAGLDTILHIGINQSQIAEKLARNKQVVLLISLCIAFVSLLFAYFWSQQITSPLARFTRQIQQFGAGEQVDFNAEKGNLPEIHLLASAFQTAVEERQQALNSLREREQNLEITLNSIGDAVITTDAEGNVTRLNPVAESLTGWSLEEAKGRSVKSIFPIVDASNRNIIENPVEKVVATGETVYLSNHTTLISRDGSEYQIADSAAPIRDADNNILGMVLVFNDVTEQYHLRQQAAESKRDMQAVMDHSPAVIYVKDLNGHFTFINQSFEQLFKINREDIDGKTDQDLFPKEYADEFQASDRAVIDAGRTLKSEERMPQDDGIHTYFSVKFPLYDSNDKIYALCGISTDITERQQTEEALRRSQKMEAIGQLSGGIAHDFNNQLGVIVGYLDFLQDYTRDQEKPHKWVETATRATLRCMDLTRQLLAFSRRQSKDKKVVMLNDIFQELETMIARSLTPEVSVQYFLADDLWRTEIDPGEFQDAILNLAINARDAMPGGGQLLIETSNKYLDDDYAMLNPDVAAGDYVQLMFSDTGSGMEKAIQEHIFEPFFTTKAEGKGTGLGLAMVYGFVKRYGGYIKVYSEPGEGTTMRLYLPRHTDDVTIVSGSSSDAELPRGSETVLIVDDEGDLLQLARQYLLSLGYQSRIAENAAQALTILSEDQSIDILFSDVVMPGGMNGYELAQKATQLRPDLKVLLTSGFTSKTIAHNGLARFSSHLLGKPYRKMDLAQRIRLVLDEKAL